MSVKKNLTVATLAALLAVPAFNGTNISHTLHISSTAAHASSLQFGDDVNPYAKASYHSTGRTGYFGSFNKNGHHFTVTTKGQGVGGRITALDGNSNATNAQVEAAFNGTGETTNSNDPESSTSTSNNTDGSANIGATNGNTNASNTENGSASQYTSKNSLPQTGESNGNSKAMVMGAITLGASASLMALSMAKKHRQESELDSVSSEPTADNDDGNDDKSNNGVDNIDTNYHMIMSDMFDNISKDLK